MGNMPDFVLSDPRLVRREIGGREYTFWLHRRSFLLAKEHGYDPSSLEEADPNDPLVGAEAIIRLAWMAYLPFEPELSFEEFDMRFLPQDYPLLAEAAESISRLQMGGGTEGEPPKKGAKARNKTT